MLQKCIAFLKFYLWSYVRDGLLDIKLAIRGFFYRTRQTDEIKCFAEIKRFIH